MKRLAIGLAIAWSVLPGCSRKAAPKQATTDDPRKVMPGGGPQLPADPAGAAPNLALAPGHDPVIYDGALLSYTVTQTVEAGSPRTDPDEAVVQAARASAAQCFPPLAEGPETRSAVLHVTVIPSGSVSRAEVSADPDVTDCLIRVGQSLRFSAKEGTSGDNGGGGIRSFSIDVSVTKSH